MQVLITTDLRSEDIDRMKAEFPAITFTIAKEHDDILRAAADSEVMFASWVSSEEIINAAPKLRWVQVRSAGVDGMPLDALFARNITLTNGSGAHSVVAENVIAMMMAFAIRLPALVEAKPRHEWIAGRVGGEKFRIEGQTLLIVGVGAIGSALAVKANGLGMHVLGIRRNPLGKPDGVDEMIAMADLNQALGRADHVALCLPATQETESLIGGIALQCMKPTAYLYNIGRGALIDRDALLKALSERAIAGAGLDVTTPEPLPPDDPLWDCENVILSQHTSGASSENGKLVTDIFMANLRRYLANEPLSNVVEPDLRY